MSNHLVLLITLVPKIKSAPPHTDNSFYKKTYSINYLIISVTKFSIVIGSPCAYLSHRDRIYYNILDRNWFVMLLERDNVGVQLQVSNYNFRTSIMNSSMGSFPVNASTVFFLKLMESAIDLFAQKWLSKCF